MLKGLDINPVSLQLAATQLMSGNTDVKYRKMGLHLMPYGPQPDGWGEVSHWPAERIAAGDWSSVVWRSPDLAAAAAEFAERGGLAAMQRETDLQDQPDAQRRIPQNNRRREQVMIHATLQTLYADYRKTEVGETKS